MSGLIDWAVSRGRMILAFVVLSVAAGVVAYVNLPKEGAPNIDVPVLYVSVPLAGVSATDSERLLVKPLEQELRAVEGLKTLTTFASDGHAGALMEFEFGWDKSATVADVRDRVDRAKTEMPEETDEPSVIEINLSEFPILILSLSGDAPERTLVRLAKDLQREIEALKEVLAASIAGKRDEMIEVVIDPLKLETYDVTTSELARVVAVNNRLVAAGALDVGGGSFAVRVPGAFSSAEELYALPVKVSGDRVVTLGDLAVVRRTFEDAEGYARYNNSPTVALQISKRVGENIIETVAKVRAVVAQQRTQWPEELRNAVRLDFSMDESIRVQSMVSQLESSVMTAVLLVMIVVLAALGMRSALLVGLAVPCSFLLAFASLALMGMNISNMVMFGLILAVGMLVDGAIVVAEFADKRLREGVEPRAAYAEAARRMFWPIVSSTATTLCAFLPMLFWPGMPGQFMRYLPITLIFVLSASLLVALIYLPVLGGLLGLMIDKARGGLAAIGLARARPRYVQEAAPSEEENFVSRLAGLIVRNPVGPFMAIGAAIAGVVGCFMIYMESNPRTEFFVKTEPERALIYVRARGNLGVEEHDRLVREVESRIADVAGVRSVFAFSGGGGLQTDDGGDSPPDAVGQVQIELAPWEERLLRPEDEKIKGDDVIAEIDARLRDLPGGFAEMSILKEGPQQGKPIQLLISAARWSELHAATKQVRAHFEQLDGLIAIDDTRPLPGIEWRLEVDRTAAGRFGADVAQIGTQIQMVTRGVTLDTYTPDDSDDEVDIVARFPEDSRDLSALDEMRIRTSSGLVPMSNFVTRTPAPSLTSIERRDGQRFFLVRANVAPDVNVQEKVDAIAKWLAERPEGYFGPTVRAEFVGDQEEQGETGAFLGQAFLGALGLMFVILLAQFNSFYNSLLVLSAVVMSVGGVLLGMVVMDQSFSIIMTGTGIVALAGIVVNNNIVLIDTYQDYAARMDKLDAIVRTVKDRMRPVLLTTITTIAGLLPMMFATSIDFVNQQVSVGAPTALWWVQLATAVVFGLGFATILTLLVTPAALAARVWVTRGVLSVFGGGEGPDAKNDAEPMRMAAE